MNSVRQMALPPFTQSRYRYRCAICLDLMRDPGTLPCGHSYCLGCITDHWNTEDARKVYSCPQCRQTFRPRPALVKTTVLAEVLEDLKKMRLQDGSPEHCYAGPGDVGCDLCVGRKRKAFKSCLVCLASFCIEHLQRHYKVPGLKRHTLVTPTADLQESLCSHHGEAIKMFCRQDQQSICCVCTVDYHKGHDYILIEAERHQRQKDLSSHQKTTQTRIQKVQEDREVLHQKIDSINQCTNGAIQEIDEIFDEIIRPIESQRSEVKEDVRTKQKAAISLMQHLEKNLEQEFLMMKSNMDDIEDLFQTQSHVTFLQRYPQNMHLKPYAALPTQVTDPMQYLRNMAVGLAKMTDKLKVFLREETPQISLEVAQLDAACSPRPEPCTRADLLQYSCDMIFDPATKTPSLSLSQENRKVTLSQQQQPATIFGKCMSKDSLMRRQYWEVKWTGRYISIAVGYKDSSWNQKGFGNDDKSWSLTVCNIGTEFEHNKITTKIPGPCPSRVGVYLDYWAGVLCFYSVSDTVTLLHKVQTVFTEPLYAGVWLYEKPGCSAEFCHPLHE